MSTHRQEGRMSKRQRLSGTPHSQSDGKELDPASEKVVKWMRDRFAGAPAVSIKLGADNTTYVFGRDTLISNFGYFSRALETREGGAMFIEGQTQHVDLYDISTPVFGRLWKWILDPDRHLLGTNNWRVVEDFQLQFYLQTIVAADYLQFRNFEEFEKHIAERLALILLSDRRRLSSDHIKLVHDHTAFKSKLIWRVLVSSGVRMFLQEHLPEKGTDSPTIGTDDPGQWIATVAHCQDLRTANPGYAISLATHVSETLKAGRDEDEKLQRAPFGYSQFNPTVPAISYTDPLLSFISFQPTFHRLVHRFTV
ncbi:hypothetical protein CONLIGDRAFT_626613 [Coniochaeta ligniaria NRRL 30616]|uniref:Uncharacterized protein n=1 Tax=Coniochaeta ligniaria NRRL 30616 TaxID=1408157 RepID=A0A1J7J5D0_9PEZI|nr:hypothetical protein CONLIGDRAFT_626613 [Coniochaeta ligniaria NRRL 30616]